MLQVVHDVVEKVRATDESDTVTAAASVNLELLANIAADPFEVSRVIEGLIADARPD
jgi:hypothetical protein